MKLAWIAKRYQRSPAAVCDTSTWFESPESVIFRYAICRYVCT